MSLYGDRGNIIVLSFLAEQIGLEFDLQDCYPGERVNPYSNIVFLGGGQDNDQEKIVEDLLQRKNELQDLITNGAIFIGVCGGYQMLGNSYESATGSTLEGLGILDFETKNAKTNERRIIGNVVAHSETFGSLVGFENHGGRTHLKGQAPLAKVIQGGGNNATDATEGVFAQYGKGHILGTYLHGFLQKNIAVSRWLIKQVCNYDYFISDPIESINQQNSMSLSY
jgi:lipid II isoglutaminyl synthase (glutamine-hydrolysing)